MVRGKPPRKGHNILGEDVVLINDRLVLRQLYHNLCGGHLTYDYLWGNFVYETAAATRL